MKLKKINSVVFVVLIMALMTVNVFAEMNVSVNDSDQPMDIRERLNDSTFNILHSGSVKYFEKIDETTEVEVDQPTVGSRLEFYIELALSNKYTGQIKGGDYFEFELPEVFKINKAIVNEQLGNYGSFSVGTDSIVRITFNENIEINSEITGDLSFSSYLDESVITTPGNYEVLMPVENDSLFNLFVKPTGEATAIEKSGRFDRKDNPNGAVWDVFINKTYETLSNAVVEDQMPDGLVTELIEVYQPVMDHAGKVLSEGEPVSTGKYSVDGNKVTFKEDIDTPYLIRYTTKIKDEFKPNDGGNLDLYNKAILTATDLKAIDASMQMVAEYGYLLNKEKPTYDSSKQLFTWNIQYNYGEKTIENGVLLDTFDENLEFIEESFSIKSKRNEEVDVKYSLVQDGNTVKIIFDEPIDEAYNISYQTKVKEGVLITENQSFSNKIKTEDKTSESSGTAVPRLVEKYAGDVNYKDKKIPWTINVNNNNYEMSNYTITDTYISGGLSMDLESFRIKNVTKDTYLDASDYELQITKENGKETGFILKLVNDYETTSDHFSITFETHYEVNDLIEKGSNIFKNHVQLKWTDEYGNEHVNDGEGDRDVNVFTVHNGRKIGSYNAVTKEITWQVDVNYNSEVISDGKVVDEIEDGQSFILDSLEIYSYTVLSNGEIQRDEKLSLNDFIIDYPSDANDQTLTVRIPEENDVKYSLQYKTSVASDVIRKTYHNHASFSNGEFTRDLKASVSVTNGNKFVSKAGIQDGDLANWQITINESQSTIKDAEIHDFPSAGQHLLEDTFKVYPVHVNENESYDIDYENSLTQDVDYEIVIVEEENGEQSFILKFKNIIDRTFVLEYSSQISLDENSREISNRVKFKGNEVTYETDEGPSRIVVDVDKAGGNAVGKTGNLRIRKVDPQGRPLSGVEFELFNRLNRKVYVKETDENGEIHFANLIFSDYMLYETKSLKGYVIPDELYNGTSVIVDNETTDDEYVLILENRMNELLINKVDSNNNPLSGARFELIKLGEPETVIAGDFEVEEAGKIFYGLDAGHYQLREKLAPEGYIINSSVHTFEIKEDENQQEIDFALDIVNYQGSVTLTKVDEREDVLEGVIFNLYDSEDNLIEENLVTDANGQIHLDNALAPKDYYFKEVKSVNGNIVNETPLYFTIVNKAEGEPSRVFVKATNSMGSVQFKKVSESLNALSGVEFELYSDTDEQLLSVHSNQEGLVRVDQLEPGNYYFKEKTPLDGYIKNTEVIEFVIPEKSETESVVLELEDFTNYRGSVTISKVDEKDNVLKEARFKVLYESDKVIKKIETINGEVHLENLSPGNYKLQEIEAPLGYVLKEDLVEFVIPDEYEGQYESELIKVVNVKEEPKVGNSEPTTPKTGIKKNTIMFVNTILIALIGFIMLFKIKRKNI